MSRLSQLDFFKRGQTEGLAWKEWLRLSSSPPQRLPMGIPIKIAIIVKIESARRMMGRGKRRKPFFSLPPSHRSPALFSSFSPVSLQHKEASMEERGWSRLAGAEELFVSLRGYVTRQEPITGREQLPCGMRS